MRKIIFVILDGIGDRPIKELGGKTPLESAYTPNLDWFSKNGLNGNVVTVGKGIAPESDIAITAILGYDPHKFYEGRGPLEAYGANLDINDGDLCLRANFATVEGLDIIDRRDGRTLTTKEAKLLADSINKEVKLSSEFHFEATVEHRGVLVIKGDFSPNISNTDPAYEKLGTFGVVGKKNTNKITISKALERSEKAKRAAELVNEFTKKTLEILKKHPINIERKSKGLLPANAVLLRDAGIKLPNFTPKIKNWASIAAMPLEIALTKIAGMESLIFTYPEVKEEGYRPMVLNNLKTEIENAKEYLKANIENYDGFYVHIKQTDIPGHDGDFELKKELLEIIDKDFIGYLGDIEEKIVLLVSGDHSTPCQLKNHSADPVPLLIYNGEDLDQVETFGETSVKKGSLKTLKGVELMRETVKLVRS